MLGVIIRWLRVVFAFIWEWAFGEDKEVTQKTRPFRKTLAMVIFLLPTMFSVILYQRTVYWYDEYRHEVRLKLDLQDKLEMLDRDNHQLISFLDKTGTVHVNCIKDMLELDHGEISVPVLDNRNTTVAPVPIRKATSPNQDKVDNEFHQQSVNDNVSASNTKELKEGTENTEEYQIDKIASELKDYPDLEILGNTAKNTLLIFFIIFLILLKI